MAASSSSSIARSSPVASLEQLAGRLGVGEQGPPAAGGGDDRVELAVARRDPAQLGGVGGDGRVGEARLEVGVLLLHGSEAGGDGSRRFGHGATRLQAADPAAS